MTEPKPLRRFFKVSEVAELWDVHRQTVYKAVNAGAIPAVRTGPSGNIRIPREAAEALVIGVEDLPDV